MTQACREPVPWAQLVDYWAGDLDGSAEGSVEEHLMGCASCTAESARIAAITETLRGMLPPIVTAELVETLRRRGRTVLENPMLPGDRKDVVFPRDVDLLIHRLGGLPLADAASVDLELLQESTGRVMVKSVGVPFDRAQGFVLLACQQHYASMPHDTLAELTVRDRSGGESQYRFTILHRFESHES